MNANDWQADFCQAIFNGLSDPLAETFQQTQASQHQQRFAIYQNNVFYSLSQALAELYPVVNQLVGDDFFQGTAIAYIRSHPPSQAAMVFFGQEFPAFLKHFEHTQAMGYLAAVAELELARHRAYHAADQEPLTPEDFAAIDAESFEQSSICLHPSVQLLESAFPIFSIWQSNQQAQPDATIDINSAESVIIARHQYEVNIFHIDSGTYGFYRCLQEGQPIGEAATAFERENPDGLTNAIALGIQQGFITALDNNSNKNNLE